MALTDAAYDLLSRVRSMYVTYQFFFHPQHDTGVSCFFCGVSLAALVVAFGWNTSHTSVFVCLNSNIIHCQTYTIISTKTRLSSPTPPHHQLTIITPTLSTHPHQHTRGCAWCDRFYMGSWADCQREAQTMIAKRNPSMMSMPEVWPLHRASSRRVWLWVWVSVCVCVCLCVSVCLRVCVCI